jgi:ubiquitin carboxyl-terminal hydrolase 36/42
MMIQNIRAVGRQFRQFRQEDAHEYLRKLIDCFHEEFLKLLGVVSKDPTVLETSMIFQIFGGTLRNELLCPRCQYSSRTYNSFLDLSLELTKGVTSVRAALQAFTQPERLSSGNEWNCDGCKQKVQVLFSFICLWYYGSLY